MMNMLYYYYFSGSSKAVLHDRLVSEKFQPIAPEPGEELSVSWDTAVDFGVLPTRHNTKQKHYQMQKRQEENNLRKKWKRKGFEFGQCVLDWNF